MLARLASRILFAPVGLVCGLFAGFLTLAFLSSHDFASFCDFPDEVILLGYDMSLTTVAVAMLLGPLMAAPAFVAVMISEMFSIRSWTYHAIAGAIAVALPWSIAPSGFEGPLFNFSSVLAAGFIGGLTHWAVAGRKAGLAPEGPPPA
ncbi:hypothetical protein ACFQI3_15315 [Hansschlegelia quercus]|uniref:Uncharacterized protein n=1 Tax=Hansschlegelia quercus TaxID=2528245 RepID=A0A4Q9GH26_9HYPH|nr:hypothetical protein [Hansschlegelia quercus]TBN48289.1 hypothetical protein EYR15_14545 [Hansschlegelia quercus]